MTKYQNEYKIVDIGKVDRNVIAWREIESFEEALE